MTGRPETTPTCAFHSAGKALLTREGDSYSCPECGWRGDAVALLMQTEGIGAREAILRIKQMREEGPSQ